MYMEIIVSDQGIPYIPRIVNSGSVQSM